LIEGELKMKMTMRELREMRVSASDADQKDSGWYGPLDIHAETADWIQNALDEHDLDLVLGLQDADDEVYVKVAPKPQEVESSMMNEIAYDEATRQLNVTFKGGSSYQYYDVEQPIFDGLEQAESKGKFFIRHVRPWYKFKRVS